MTSERLKYIQNWYQQQQKVVAQIPPHITERQNGTKVTTHFNGYRGGVKFVDGFAGQFVEEKNKDGKVIKRYWENKIDRTTAKRLKEAFPYVVIHENEVQK